MKPLKDAVRIMLRKIVATTYYPQPPTSGIKTTMTVYSSREWHDWFVSLDAAQRSQLIRDCFK